MKKIKVAHIITRLILGGAQENTLLSVEGLYRNPRYHVDLITGPALGPEGSLMERARDHDVNVILVRELRRNINLVFDVIAFIKLIRILKKEQYDIVHTHSSKAGILARLAAKICKVPIIIHTIHGLPFHEYEKPSLNRLYIFLERWVARYTTNIVAVSPEMKRKAIEAGVGIEEQYTIIYSGMEIDTFMNVPHTTRERVRDDLGIPKEAVVVGKIARLFSLKGYEYLFPVAQQIIRKNSNVYFILVGDGMLRQRFEREVAILGIERNVFFVGLVRPDEVPTFLSAMDIVVHLSLREGLPRVVPQAFLMEKPVVVFDVDGAKDIVDHEKNGFLIPAKSEKTLHESLEILINDEQMRRTMGRSGKEKAERLFSCDRMIDALDALYQKQYSRIAL